MKNKINRDFLEIMDKFKSDYFVFRILILSVDT